MSPVGRHDRDCLRLRILPHRQVEKAFCEGWLRVWPVCNHAEVVHIIECAIHRGPEQTDEYLASLHGDRHCRLYQVCAVATDDQVDLVDVEQLGIDAGYHRLIGFIIIINELHGTAEQSASSIDILFPDLLGEQRGPAVGRKPAAQRHAVADLDGVARLRRRRGGNENSGEKRGDGEESAGYRARKSLDVHLK